MIVTDRIHGPGRCSIGISVFAIRKAYTKLLIYLTGLWALWCWEKKFSKIGQSAV